MSQATAAPQSAPNPIDDMPEAYRRQMWRRIAGVRMLNTLMDMDRLQEQARLVRRLVRKTQDGTLGKPDSDADQSEAEDMGAYQVGDNIHYHYPASPEQSSPPPQATPPQPAVPSWLKSALLVAAAAAAGAGVPALWRQMQDQPNTTVVVPPGVDTDTDTDTQYEIGLSQE